MFKSKALKRWQEKLDSLLESEAIESDPAQKFKIKALIEEAREQIVELSGMPHPGPQPSGPQPHIPYLLPFLPNRQAQEEELLDLIGSPPRDSPHPYLFLVHGGCQQSHGTFLDKLKKHILPSILALDSTRQSVQDWRPRWPPFQDTHQLHERLRRNLANEVLGRKDATLGEIQTRFAGIPSPVLIHTHLMTQDWENHEFDILDGFVDFWQSWPELAPYQRLFVFLSIKYQDNFQGGYFRRRRLGKLNDRIRRSIASLGLACRNRLNGAVLSELTSVQQREVEEWAEEHGRKHRFNTHELIREIGRIFRRQDAFPMDKLADELRIILKSQEART